MNNIATDPGALNVAEYCLEHLGAEETYPFGPEVTVMKVSSKVFAIMPAVDEPATISLKCDPTRAIALRQSYPEITPGYHLNKQHWNTLDLTGRLPEDLVRELIDHSYELVKPRG
jgi:predicted DNA-binding protein (MmcQ/YjbR family)